ncbi:MAG: hypothetical protein KDD73_07925 [Anaerolineales bacterium]|nr:hypothetical protein [Anaerolineales bacterium]
MREAIRILKSGDRERAFQMLWDYLSDNPRDPNGWIWLSEAAPTTQGTIVALEEALAVEPNQPHAATIRQRIEMLRDDLRAAGDRLPSYEAGNALSFLGRSGRDYATADSGDSLADDVADLWHDATDAARDVGDNVVDATQEAGETVAEAWDEATDKDDDHSVAERRVVVSELSDDEAATLSASWTDGIDEADVGPRDSLSGDDDLWQPTSVGATQSVEAGAKEAMADELSATQATVDQASGDAATSGEGVGAKTTMADELSATQGATVARDVAPDAAGGTRSQVADDLRETQHDADSRWEDGAAEGATAAAAVDFAGGTKEALSDELDEAQERAASRWDDTGDAVEARGDSLWDDVKDTAHDAKEAVADKVDDAADAMSDETNEAKHDVTSLWDDAGDTEAGAKAAMADALPDSQTSGVNWFDAEDVKAPESVGDTPSYVADERPESQHDADSLWDDAGATVLGATGAATHGIGHGTKDRVSDEWDETQDSTDSLWDDAAERVDDSDDAGDSLWDDMKETAHDAKEAVADTVDDAVDAVSGETHDATSRWDEGEDTVAVEVDRTTDAVWEDDRVDVVHGDTDSLWDETKEAAHGTKAAILDTVDDATDADVAFSDRVNDWSEAEDELVEDGPHGEVVTTRRAVSASAGLFPEEGVIEEETRYVYSEDGEPATPWWVWLVVLLAVALVAYIIWTALNLGVS